MHGGLHHSTTTLSTLTPPPPPPRPPPDLPNPRAHRLCHHLHRHSPGPRPPRKNHHHNQQLLPFQAPPPTPLQPQHPLMEHRHQCPRRAIPPPSCPPIGQGPNRVGPPTRFLHSPIHAQSLHFPRPCHVKSCYCHQTRTPRQHPRGQHNARHVLHFERPDLALQVFEEIPNKDIVSYTTMMSAHARNADVANAVTIFQSMQEKDTVAWGAMLTCLARNGHH